MTDGFDQALANAGLDLLRADTSLTVYPDAEGYVPNSLPDHYVRVYTHIEWPTGAPGDSLDGLSGSPTVRWYCHCIGANDIAARAVAQRVRTQLLNQRPAVTGLGLGLIRQEFTAPPTRDESTGAVVMDAVAVYRLDATT